MRKLETSTKCSTRVLLSLLLLVLLLAQQTWAGKHWFSTVRKEKQRSPLTLDSQGMQTSATSDPVVFDVVISLYNDPNGDKDLATQDDRTPYEDIIKYFADGVYEESNAAHKIGKVRIYTGGDYSDKCDILWEASGWPNANVSGCGTSGLHVRMFTNFNSTNFLVSKEAGGYCLAHEWGHYFYCLYDEYKSKPGQETEGGILYDDIFYFPHSTDDATNVAIMNSQWSAVGGHNDWLNFSTSTIDDYNPNNAQYRVYQAAAWQTLSRKVSKDPRDGERKSLPKRIYYSELAAVAPTENRHEIELPGTARSDLEIIWMTEDSGLVYQIVIDYSGSMGYEVGKMENAKTAAKLLVDLAEIDKTMIGVIKFDDEVNVVSPLTSINSEATKNAIKNQIDTIYSDGSTAMGDAAQKALNDLLALGTTDDTKVVFLLTDGMSNTGIDPLSVIPGYQSAQIPLFTFAYGSDADQTTLKDIAEATGGQFYFSPTTLSEITKVFNDAQQQASQSKSLTAASSTLDQLQSFYFPVDSTLKRLDLIVTYHGNPGDAQVGLFDPCGVEVLPTDVVQSGSETLYQFSVDNPAVGEWLLRASSLVGPIDFSYHASGLPADQITYSLSINNLTGNTVQYPEPIVLLVCLEKELPIAGAVVNAEIKAPDGTTTVIELKDDGVAPDNVANDGYYSAIIGYNQNGMYEITVTMNNSAGLAVLTYNGLQPSADINGNGPGQLPDEPVTENFSRSAYLQVTVEGLQADDHGNNAGTSTQLNTESVDVPGKIDYAGDLDMFSLDVPSGMDTLVVRVTDHALGMESRLRIFSSDGVIVIAEKTLAPASLGIEYVLVKIDVNEGDRLYAEVSHVNTTANTGTYNISAGTLLASEQMTFDLTNLAKLASYWLDNDCGVFDWCNGADGSRDGKVDFLDFAILADSWPDSPSEFEPDMIWVSINDSGAGMKDKNGNPISQGGFAGEMNKYETTNAQYCYFLNNALASGDITVGSDNIVYGANGSNSGVDFVGEIYFRIYPASSYSQITYSGGTFSVRSRDGYDMSNHPVVMVSWYGATAFSNYYGWRLPTEWEWQAVADYDGGYIYGCGISIDQSKANYYAGEDANPLGLTSTPYTSPINHYPSYGYGMNDMAGNVLEWTSTVSGDSYRIFRGGSWATNSSSCTVAIRSSLSPFLTHYNVGFRVCR